MKRILILLAVISMTLFISACNKTNEELPVTKTSESQQQATQNENTPASASDTKTPQANNYYQQQEEEESKQTSTTVAISNAIIVEDNHEDMVVYKKKCDTCGYVEPGTITTTPGSFTGGFYCPDCEEQKVIKIQTTYSY